MLSIRIFRNSVANSWSLWIVRIYSYIETWQSMGLLENAHIVTAENDGILSQSNRTADHCAEFSDCWKLWNCWRLANREVLMLLTIFLYDRCGDTSNKAFKVVLLSLVHLQKTLEQTLTAPSTLIMVCIAAVSLMAADEFSNQLLPPQPFIHQWNY